MDITDGQRGQLGCREINAISQSIGLGGYTMPRKQKRAGSVMSMVSSMSLLIVRKLMGRYCTWYLGVTEVSTKDDS
jgi:hypothetical protein